MPSIVYNGDVVVADVIASVFPSAPGMYQVFVTLSAFWIHFYSLPNISYYEKQDVSDDSTEPVIVSFIRKIFSWRKKAGRKIKIFFGSISDFIFLNIL
jgi:hypothetical protein